MGLVTVSQVEDALGETFDSAETVRVQSMINAVSNVIENYCDRQFAANTYIARHRGVAFTYQNSDVGGFDDNEYNYKKISPMPLEIRLKNTPIDNVFYSAYGETNVIDITYSGTGVASIYRNSENEIKINDGLVATNITLSNTTTIGSLATSINALANFTATVEADYQYYPAYSICNIYQGPDESTTNTTFYFTASINKIKLQEISDGVFYSNVKVSETNPWITIYYGGYATIPDDIQQICIQLVCSMWYQYGSDNTLKSEKIGDYSYTKNNSSFILNSLSEYADILDAYRVF